MNHKSFFVRFKKCRIWQLCLNLLINSDIKAVTLAFLKPYLPAYLPVAPPNVAARRNSGKIIIA